MKPKPFRLSNHFTVPVFMGALPVGTCGYRLRANAAGSFEILGECRQSGALFAARPSRSAETRSTAHRAFLLDPQEPRSNSIYLRSDWLRCLCGFCRTLHSASPRPSLRAVRSVLSDEKKLSIAALSQTLPDRLIEQATPLSAMSRWNCSLVYW